MKLTAENVHNIFLDCLFNEHPKEGTEYIPSKGIIINIGFDPSKIEEHCEEIYEMLHELPDQFMKEKGGGYSFLAACEDKHGNHWGEHRTMDELFTLGIASGYANYLFPREMWSVLPGGVPYVVVFKERQEVRKIIEGE